MATLYSFDKNSKQFGFEEVYVTKSSFNHIRRQDIQKDFYAFSFISPKENDIFKIIENKRYVYKIKLREVKRTRTLTPNTCVEQFPTFTFSEEYLSGICKKAKAGDKKICYVLAKDEPTKNPRCTDILNRQLNGFCKTHKLVCVEIFENKKKDIKLIVEVPKIGNHFHESNIGKRLDELFGTTKESNDFMDDIKECVMTDYGQFLKVKHDDWTIPFLTKKIDSIILFEDFLDKITKDKDDMNKRTYDMLKKLLSSGNKEEMFIAFNIILNMNFVKYGAVIKFILSQVNRPEIYSNVTVYPNKDIYTIFAILNNSTVEFSADKEILELIKEDLDNIVKKQIEDKLFTIKDKYQYLSKVIHPENFSTDNIIY